MKAIVLIVLLIEAYSLAFRQEKNVGDPSAVCLNGDSSFIYLTEEPSTAKGIIIFFMSTPQQNFCGGTDTSSSLENCIKAQDQITNYWKPTLQINQGILADNFYSDWIKVIIPSCDGSIFYGNARYPIQYKKKSLYLRGNKIVKSAFQNIRKRYLLISLDKFVIAGSRLGSIGALTWSNYFHDEIFLNLGKGKQYYLILDSPPYISFTSQTVSTSILNTRLQYLHSLVGKQQSHPFFVCGLRFQNNQYKCLDILTSYPFLENTAFIVISDYDQFTAKQAVQVDCISSYGSLSSCSQNQRKQLQILRSKQLTQMIKLANFNHNSVWSIGCSATSLLQNSNYNSQNWVVSNTVAESIKDFINGQKIALNDPAVWPQNKACSGL